MAPDVMTFPLGVRRTEGAHAHRFNCYIVRAALGPSTIINSGGWAGVPVRRRHCQTKCAPSAIQQILDKTEATSRRTWSLRPQWTSAGHMRRRGRYCHGHNFRQTMQTRPVALGHLFWPPWPQDLFQPAGDRPTDRRLHPERNELVTLPANAADINAGDKYIDTENITMKNIAEPDKLVN